MLGGRCSAVGAVDLSLTHSLLQEVHCTISDDNITSFTAFSILGEGGQYSRGIPGQTRLCEVLLSGAPGPTTASFEPVPPKMRSMTYLGPSCMLIMRREVEKVLDEGILKDVCSDV